MTLARLVRDNAEAINKVGLRALEEAKQASVPAYYMDRSLGGGIIREWPDGSRERIEHQEGQMFVLKTYAPAYLGGTSGVADHR